MSPERFARRSRRDGGLEGRRRRSALQVESRARPQAAQEGQTGREEARQIPSHQGREGGDMTTSEKPGNPSSHFLKIEWDGKTAIVPVFEVGRSGRPVGRDGPNHQSSLGVSAKDDGPQNCLHCHPLIPSRPYSLSYRREIRALGGCGPPGAPEEFEEEEIECAPTLDHRGGRASPRRRHRGARCVQAATTFGNSLCH